MQGQQSGVEKTSEQPAATKENGKSAQEHVPTTNQDGKPGAERKGATDGTGQKENSQASQLAAKAAAAQEEAQKVHLEILKITTQCSLYWVFHVQFSMHIISFSILFLPGLGQTFYVYTCSILG